MRKVMLAAAAAALLAVAPFGSKPAQAMALPAPAGLNDAIGAIDVTENVNCQMVWRCGYYGCGWRRVCWAPRYYSHYRPYYRPYYQPHYRPYYRPYSSYRPYNWGYQPNYYRPYRSYRYYRPYSGYRYGGYRRYW